MPIRRNAFCKKIIIINKIQHPTYKNPDGGGNLKKKRNRHSYG